MVFPSAAVTVTVMVFTPIASCKSSTESSVEPRSCDSNSSVTTTEAPMSLLTMFDISALAKRWPTTAVYSVVSESNAGVSVTSSDSSPRILEKSSEVSVASSERVTPPDPSNSFTVTVSPTVQSMSEVVAVKALPVPGSDREKLRLPS